jgi:hypothetical protein
MSSTGDALGGRLPLAHRSTMSESQLQLYDRMTKSVVPWSEHAGFASQSSNGRFIGPFNPALHSPIICGSFLDFQACEEENSSLAPRVRQVVILAVGLYGARRMSSTPTRRSPARPACPIWSCEHWPPARCRVSCPPPNGRPGTSPTN